MAKSKVNRRKVSAREVGPPAGSAVAERLLSPELMAELGQVDHGSGIGLGGALAVTTKPKKVKKRGRTGGQEIDAETRDLASKMNKSKARKLKQIQDKKAKDSRRADLYRKLEVNRLSQEHMSLLRSSKTISQSKETLRSRIKQAVQQAIAGIKLEGAAVAELEAHPDMVADVEESLSLPVGGALIAATRRTPTGTPSLERVPMKADGKVTAPRIGKDREAKKASNSSGRQTDKESGMTNAKAGKGKGSAATTATASGAKRGRSRISAASKPVVVISASRAGSSSDSCSDDESEDDGEGEDTQTGRGDEAGEDLGGVSSASAAVAAVDNATARAAGEGEDRRGGEVETPSGEKVDCVVSNDAPAESAGSWAAKMMSSLAHVATTKVAAGSASTRADLSSGKVDASGQGGDGAIGGEGSARDMEDAEVTSEMSYPPPPSWLQGKAPAYRAVETPLPSASGVGGSNGLRLPRPQTLVSVKRSVDLQAARMQLPVCGMEQEIMEAIHDNDTVILCGETGSGKSTQVPQFLYEAGYAAHGLIGVTQPRRVAAVGTAERVAVELGTKCGRGGAVAYQIRYDASGVGEKTRVKFMTDGVLLREITSDILLRKYSVVLLDEAHERNLNTDVLLGMLSRSIPLRKQVAEDEQRSWEMLSQESRKGVKPPLRPLKLVIMSATLRVTDFTENSPLFPTPPPVITATGREHKVFVHFNKRTALSDYVGKTFQKVCKIHRLLPDGGILVFLTGKREILHMCDKLRREFPPPRASKRVRGPIGHTSRGELNRAGDSDQPVEEGQDVMKDKDEGGHVEEAGGAGAEVGPDANGGEAKTATYREKPRETDKESILFREADDDEEDAARLADMGDAGEVDAASSAKEASRPADVEDILKENAVGDDRSGATLDGNRRYSGDKEGDSGDLQGNISDLEGESSEEEGEEGSAFPDAPPPPLEALLPPVYVVPLYAMLTAEEQARVFQAPPEGHRLIVVATNVAETSITIPGISYVVDCGRQKRRLVQRDSGISRFEVGWISRASADQRAGRSGRTGRGNCFRLFSSAVYSQTLEPFEPPDVLTRPLEDIVLQMKAMGIVDVSRFPFPTAPDAAGLRAATSLLANLGATAGRGNLGGGESDGTGKITPVGKALALLPVGARYAKMLLLAFQGGVRHHASAMVAMLAEGDPFVRPDSVVTKGEKDQEMVMIGEGVDGISDAEEVRRKRAVWFHPNSDALARLKAAGAYAHATERGTAAGSEGFCRDNLLHAPTMQRALQLRRQLTQLVDLRFGTETGGKGSAADKRLKPPSRRQSDTLRQVVLTGLLDNVARRAPAGTVKAGTKLQKDCAYLSCNEAIAEPLYIKGTSVLFSRDPGDLPEWVVYQSIVRGEKEGAPANMTCVTAIEPSWLPSLAEGSPLLTFSEPLASPPPYYDGESDTVMCRVTPRYGVHAWALPPHCVELAAAAPANKPDAVVKWFGKLLLEGGVAGCLSELKGRDMLNDPPSMLTRDRPSKKVSIILLELRRKGVCCLLALVRQWRKNPAYLKDAVALWVKVNKREAFDAVWANAIRTAVLALKAKARRKDGEGEAATGGAVGAAASGDSGNGREDKAGNEPVWKRLKTE